MSDNAAFYAIRNALYRRLPEKKNTPEGREEIEAIVMEAMNNIREAGLEFIKQGELQTHRPDSAVTE